MAKVQVIQDGQWQGRRLRRGQVFEMDDATAEAYAAVGQVAIVETKAGLEPGPAASRSTARTRKPPAKTAASDDDGEGDDK